MSEIEELQKTIDMLESQRAVLGNPVVDAALAPLQQKLAALRQETISEQRKIVTVLFADLEGFTAMSEQMDPEDVREILHGYFTRWNTAIESFGGVTEKFIGDAVMAVFGLHIAREDDAERAVRAALAMQAELKSFNQVLEVEHGLQLHMRVGIHTGQVVVGALGERKGQDFVIVGDSVNLTSRLQAAAPPGGILITHDTFRLVRGVFNIQPLDPIKVKGKSEPVRVYLISGIKARPLPQERSQTETPLIGREKELDTLMHFLQQAADQHCQQRVLVIADAGMGKTRLVDAFEYQMELLPSVIRYFKGRASPYLQQQPYALLRDLFSYRFGIQDSDSPDSAVEKLVSGLGNAKMAFAIGQLLGFSDGGESSSSDAREIRDQALLHMVHFFQQNTADRPVAVVLEDLQWADDSSLEILSVLQRELEDQSIAWVATARPEFLERLPQPEPAAWGSESAYQARIDLHPLSDQDSINLLEALLQQADPAAGVNVDGALGQIGQPQLRDLFLRSAEGNPFFIEELLRMLIEEGTITVVDGAWRITTEQLANVHIPPTLAEFLQARLDRLPAEERVLLQRAAVVGRVFWDQAVEFLSTQPGSSTGPLSSEPAADRLKRLRENDVILQRDVSHFEGTSEYLFAHNLFRDVTYGSLLKRQRRVYHTYAARWLEQVTERSHRTDEYAALIAEHYALAEEREPAARWYQRAGMQAAARYANTEAIHHLSRALDLLPPEDAAGQYDILRTREHVNDRLVNRPAQMGDLETLEALSEQLGDPHRQAEVRVRKANLAFQTGDYPLGIQAAQEAIVLAGRAGDARLVCEAEVIWGRMLLWQSENTEAEQHLNAALALARSNQLADLEATCLWNLGVIASNMGAFDPALEFYEEALRRYRQLGDRTGEGLAIAQIGVVRYNQGRVEDARQNWEIARDIFHWTGHRIREATLLNNLGAIAYDQEHYAVSLRMRHQALAIYEEAEDKSGMAVTLTNLGLLAMTMGQPNEARVHFDRALANSSEINDRYVQSLLHADRCQFFSVYGDADQAIREGEAAVTMARDIEASYIESFTLARLARAYLEGRRLDEAERHYQQAIEMLEAAEMEANAVEARVGQAAAALERGDTLAASGRIAEVLDTLIDEDINKCDDVGWVYQKAYQVLKTTGDPRAAAVLRRGQAVMSTRAGHIEDPEKRQSFLENIPSNKFLFSTRDEV